MNDAVLTAQNAAAAAPQDAYTVINGLFNRFFNPLLITAFCLALLAIIPAKIAEKKCRTFGKWYVYGFFLFPVALVHAILLKKPLNYVSLEGKSKVKKPFGDSVLDVITSALLVLIIIVVGYPVIYVVSASVSSATALQNGQVILLPVNPGLDGYRFVLQYKMVWIGYRNTIFYTVTGTVLKMFLQILCAYPLSRPNFKSRSVYTKVLLVTMLVSAGLVPNFLIKSSLGLYNTFWVVIISGAISTHNVFILRTSFKSSIPQDLFDAAAIDGANEFQCLWKIAIPLAKATISVVTLYAIVGCWNDYFTAMIYLRDENLFPLQLVLRTILTSSKSLDVEGMSATEQQQAQNAAEQIRYALIVIATVPVLVAYRVVQKYFKTGVMIGSVKG